MQHLRIVLRVNCRLILVALLMAMVGSVSGSNGVNAQANDNFRWQQQRAMEEQRRQQDMMRQDQQRRQQDAMRQEQQRQQMDSMRRQQETQRQQDQARRLNDEMRRRQANDSQNRVHQQRRNDVPLAMSQRTLASSPSTAATVNAASARQETSRKLADLVKPPSLADIKKAFRGQFAADGRAVVRVRGRTMLVNANLVGRRPPLTQGVAANRAPDILSTQRLPGGIRKINVDEAGRMMSGNLQPRPPSGSDGATPPRRLTEIFNEAARGNPAYGLHAYSNATHRLVYPPAFKDDPRRVGIRDRMKKTPRAFDTLMYLDGHKMTALAFRQSNTELSIDHIRTKELGRGMGDAFVVEALDQAGVEKLPPTLRLSNVTEKETLAQLNEGLTPIETTLGKLAVRIARGFGQEVVSISIEQRNRHGVVLKDFDLVATISE